MTTNLETDETVDFEGRWLAGQWASDGSSDYAEVLALKPQFRERLGPLIARGLLAAGVRAILEENGFGRNTTRRDCGCRSCVQRCQGCASLRERR